MVLGTVAYRQLEEWTWIESFYFTVVTITTVGYGDLQPSSDASRMFTSIFIFFGVGIAIAGLSLMGHRYFEQQRKNIDLGLKHIEDRHKNSQKQI